MPDDSKSAKNATIAVAVIGAIATLGAAYFSNSDKSKDQPAAPAAVQQTSSGAGAINVGHDAVINNVKSPGEEAAELVQACEQRHGMKVSLEKADSTETIPATAYDKEQVVEHIDFRSCTWPKGRYSDGDGFMQISVRTVPGPGEYEATGTTFADRIKAPCDRLVLGYGFGSQGTFDKEPPFTIKADTVMTGENHALWKNDNTMPFYPDAGEFVVLHNSHDSLQTAQCAP